MDVCTQCTRAGSDVGTCGSPLTCPKTVRPVSPTADVVFHCTLCNVTRAVSAGQMMSGRLPNLEASCQREVRSCQAQIIPTAVDPDPKSPTKRASAKGA